MGINVVGELNHRGRRLGLPNYRKSVSEVAVHGRRGVLVRFIADEANRPLYENNITACLKLAELGLPGPRLLHRDDERMEFITTHLGKQLDIFIAEAADRFVAERAVAQAVAYIAKVNRATSAEVEFVRPEYVERVVSALETCPGPQRDGFWSRLPRLRELTGYLDARWTGHRLREGLGMADLHVSNLAVGSDGQIAMFDFDHFREYYNVNYLLAYVRVTLSWSLPDRWRDLPALVDEEARKTEGWSQELYAYGQIACHATKLLDRYLPEVRGMAPAVASTTHEDVSRAIAAIERLAEAVLDA